jgi:hypothetical protein
MSWLQTLTVLTFHALNPDWKIRVYMPEEQANDIIAYIPDYTGPDYFYLVKYMPYVEIVKVRLSKYRINAGLHNILRSDILRFHLLYEQGGIWSDFDVIWLKPIDKLSQIVSAGKTLTKSAEGFVCMHKTSTGFHSNGILGSIKGSEFYKRCIHISEQIQEEMDVNKIPHQAFGPTLFNQNFSTFDRIEKKYPTMVGIPYKTFYPYSSLKRDLDRLYKESNEDYLHPEVIAVHWYNGHPLSKEFVNMNRYFKYECTMNSILSLIKTTML